MDSLQGWAEPIVRVQSLSDSGIDAIPDRYIKPPSERPSLQSGTKQELCIPIIDLHGLKEDEVFSDTVMETISNACKEWGFFQVVNHGVSLELMARVRDVWKEFFHLTMEEKQVYSNSPVTYEGYGSRLGVGKGAVLDWSDYFFLHLSPESLKDLEKWPSLPTSLRETTESYGNEVKKLCMALMKLLSLSLGLQKSCFQEAFGGEADAGATLRACYYPKCPQPELTLGLSRHSDPGGLTVLLADQHVGGLQVRRGEDWTSVKPVPGAFIINIGDQIQMLSNGIYKSVEHRVVANSSEGRLSIVFFYNPKGDLEIGPVPELMNQLNQPPLYPRITFNEYRLFIRKNGPLGKSQVESLKGK